MKTLLITLYNITHFKQEPCKHLANYKACLVICYGQNSREFRSLHTSDYLGNIVTYFIPVTYLKGYLHHWAQK